MQATTLALTWQDMNVIADEDISTQERGNTQENYVILSLWFFKSYCSIMHLRRITSIY